VTAPIAAIRAAPSVLTKSMRPLTRLIPPPNAAARFARQYLPSL
jgi:hypothetical protein